MKYTISLLFVLSVVGAKAACTGPPDGHTCTAADTSYAAVSAEVAKAVSGDTVIVPAGEVNWTATQKLTYAKDIKLIGAGMDEAHDVPDKARATIIHLGGPTFVDATFQATDSTARISGFVLELQSTGNGYVLNLHGRSFRHRQGATVPVDNTKLGNPLVGGLRVDHIRFRNSADPTPPVAGSGIGANAGLINWSGDNASAPNNYITGRLDHNFIDYKPGTSGAEVSSVGATGTPNASLDGNGAGSWSWGQSYTYGGGDDTENLCVFVEDNIFHRMGFDLGTLAGGARFVNRYNTSWGGITSHGIDGGNLGPCSWEELNNWMDIKQQGANAFNLRGGSHVSVNNYMTATGPPIEPNTYRPNGTSSHTIGPASGRNFLDENWRGPLTRAEVPTIPAGVTITPVSTPSDSRIGSIYFSGASLGGSGSSYTLPGVNGGALGANALVGFTLVDTTVAPNATGGDQQQGPANAGNTWYKYIVGSDTSNPVKVSTSSGALGTSIAAGHNWELRRVKAFAFNPGAGKHPFLSTGGLNIQAGNDGTDTKGFAYKVGATIDGNVVHKYFNNGGNPGQFAFGHWFKGNLWRKSATTAFNKSTHAYDIAKPGTVDSIPGGLNNDAIPSQKKNDGTGGGAYPSAASSNPILLRVGAHWQAPGYSEGLNCPGDPACPTVVYGSQAYPNATGETAPPAGRPAAPSNIKVTS